MDEPRPGQRTAFDSLMDALMREFPIRNQSWEYISGVGHFSTEQSVLSQTGSLDPWNRPLGHTAIHRDGENEITHWTAETSINGSRIPLFILND